MIKLLACPFFCFGVKHQGVYSHDNFDWFQQNGSGQLINKSKRTIPVLLYQHKGLQRGIGFTLSPLYLHDEIDPDLEQMLFIYDEDFIHIRPAIEKAFPLTDPQTGEEMAAFDPCWDNPVMKDVWESILTEIDQRVIDETDSELQLFLGQFTTWIRTSLKLAEGIEITGNL